VSRDVCGKCHGSEQLNTRYKLPSDRVKTFFESYHGLAVKKGSTTAANCSSCHGHHKILASSDPNSTIHKDHLVETCGKCHPGATKNFAQAQVHVDLAYGTGTRDVGQRVNWWVRKIYLGLIFGVIGAMLLHNFLVFFKKMAARSRAKNRVIVRMDFSQRAQHLVLAVSFFILGWTGFALKFPDSWIGHFPISDEWARGWVHRIAGVALLLVGLYHLIYIATTRQGKRLVGDMAPQWKDLRDVVETILFLIGVRPVKPAIGRFGYAEKVEYWAVVWGIIIMGITGMVIWFKIEVTRWFPRWVIDVATTIHYYEAALACLAIVVWHFYHVIFDPDVYPLNPACLDGRVTKEWLHEEHPLDKTGEPVVGSEGSKTTPTTKPSL
jgi:formate dehydrogenase gamma subunit